MNKDENITPKVLKKIGFGQVFDTDFRGFDCYAYSGNTHREFVIVRYSEPTETNRERWCISVGGKLGEYRTNEMDSLTYEFFNTALKMCGLENEFNFQDNVSIFKD